MKNLHLTQLLAAAVASFVLASCEPGAQRNTLPGDRESSGADNALEHTGTGTGASPDQVPPSKPE